ncbi:WD40 repeat-like family [Trichomonas vaginalis G3]|uniref:WD40 repeat-like family n=1 Tax=Trichomonas vaginalis (strain ATCC PRA-98 / G3) TaxID=412133 RepID=UPI0021E532B3|nr:WD40 repeat-like family [Trichomonas vaginalis G3]KAI5540402.1 WD40 repeat-like family [Trichomonas vaginalis G3]
MDHSKIQFGIFDEPTPSVGRVRTNSVYSIGGDSFVATTQKEIVIFKGREIKSRYPFKCLTTVFIPELDVIVGLTMNTNQFIAFQTNNTESTNLLLSGIDSKHISVFHMIYSPKSHAILTVGNGVKVWTLTSDRWNNRKTSIPPTLSISLRSSFASDYQVQILNPPTFDYESEYILIPTTSGLRPFDLDGNQKNAVSLYPTLSISSNSADPTTAIRTCVSAMWCERSKKKKLTGEYKYRKNYMTCDSENGLCIWGTRGNLKKRIGSTIPNLLMLQYLDEQNVIYMDSRGIFYLLNIYTERFFPCYNMDKLPSRVFVFRTLSGLKIAYCQDLSFNLLRVEIPWSAWLLNLRECQQILRSPRYNDAARVVVFTNNSFVKLYATQNSSLITAATQKSSSPPIGVLYDRGIHISTKFNQSKNKTEYEICQIRDDVAHDQLFTILDNGDVVSFDTSVQPAEEIFTMSVKCNIMTFVKFEGKWNYAFVSKESDFYIYDYDTLKSLKRFRVSKEIIVGFYYHAESDLAIIIYQNETVLFDLNRSQVVSSVKFQSSNIHAFYNDQIYFGYKTGHLGRIYIKNRELFIRGDTMPRPHMDAITGFTFGESYWATSSMDRTVQIFDYNYMGVVRIELPLPIYSLEFLNGKRDLLLATDNEIMIIYGSEIFCDDVDTEIPEIDNFDKILDLLSSVSSIRPEEEDDDEQQDDILKGISKKDSKPDLLKLIELRLEKENKLSMERLKSYQKETTEITGNKSSEQNGDSNNNNSNDDPDDDEKRRLIEEMTAMTNENPVKQPIVQQKEKKEENQNEIKEDQQKEEQKEQEQTQEQQDQQPQKEQKKPKKRKRPEISPQDLINKSLAQVEELESKKERRKRRKAKKTQEKVEEEKPEESSAESDLDINDLYTKNEDSEDEFKDYKPPPKREVKIEIKLVKTIQEEPKERAPSKKQKPVAPKEDINELPVSPRNRNKIQSPTKSKEVLPKKQENTRPQTSIPSAKQKLESNPPSSKQIKSKNSKPLQKKVNSTETSSVSSKSNHSKINNVGNSSPTTKNHGRTNNIPRIPPKTAIGGRENIRSKNEEENEVNSVQNEADSNKIETNSVQFSNNDDPQLMHGEEDQNETSTDQSSQTSPLTNEIQNNFEENNQENNENNEETYFNEEEADEETEIDEINDENLSNSAKELRRAELNKNKIIRPRRISYRTNSDRSILKPPPLSARLPSNNNFIHNQPKIKKGMKEIDPQMAHLLGVSQQPDYLRSRAPTPPPIRWGNQLISQRLFNPKYDYNKNNKNQRVFTMPPPNIVIDPSAVLAEYGKGWEDLRPLIEKLLNDGEIDENELMNTKLFYSGNSVSPPSEPRGQSPRKLTRRNSTLLPVPGSLTPPSSSRKLSSERKTLSFANHDFDIDINDYVYQDMIGGYEVSPLYPQPPFSARNPPPNESIFSDETDSESQQEKLPFNVIYYGNRQSNEEINHNLHEIPRPPPLIVPQHQRNEYSVIDEKLTNSPTDQTPPDITNFLPKPPPIPQQQNTADPDYINFVNTGSSEKQQQLNVVNSNYLEKQQQLNVVNSNYLEKQQLNVVNSNYLEKQQQLNVVNSNYLEKQQQLNVVNVEPPPIGQQNSAAIVRPRRRNLYMSSIQKQDVIEQNETDNPYLPDYSQSPLIIQNLTSKQYIPFWMSLIEKEPPPDASPVAKEIRELLVKRKEEIEKSMKNNPSVITPRATMSFVQNNAKDDLLKYILERKERNRRISNNRQRIGTRKSVSNRAIVKPFWRDYSRKTPRKEFSTFDGAMRITRIPLSKPSH